MARKVWMTSIMIAMIFSISFASFASQQGYLEVDLNSKNYKKYFSIMKYKYKDPTGDYVEIGLCNYSKLLKKGYHLLTMNNYKMKGVMKYRCKYKNGRAKKSINTVEWNSHGNFLFNKLVLGEKCDYDYLKPLDFQVKSVKGKAVFIEPDNILSIEPYYGYAGNIVSLDIRVKHPYVIDNANRLMSRGSYIENGVEIPCYHIHSTMNICDFTYA